MAEVREILIDWTVSSGKGGVSVLHTDAIGDPGSALVVLNTILDQMSPLLGPGTVWRVRQEGRVFDATTGDLVDQWTTPQIAEGAGSGSSNPIPNSSQVLIRLATGSVYLGRFVKGRMFVPALINAATNSGEIIPAQAAAIASAFAPLATGDGGFVVWSRPQPAQSEPVPKPARAGEIFPVTAVSCWTELAVLRRRR